MDELNIPEEYADQIEKWVDSQIKLGMKQFISRFIGLLSKSMHGFAVLRALGYHVNLTHKDKPIKSLRQIADHFKCSHQLIDQLTKDFEKQLGIKNQSLEINKKRHSMKITAPKGWLTLGDATKKINITRRHLLRIIEEDGLEIKNYKRNSKLVKEKDILALVHLKKRKYNKREHKLIKIS